jgi:tetratricopeptide (TPR) repeat protein
MAACHEEMGEYEKALTFYRKSNQLQPDDYYCLKPLLGLELDMKEYAEARKTMENFFELDPKNPQIYNDLYELYTSVDRSRDLLGFFDSKKEKFKDDPTALGNLFFYSGKIEFDLKKCQESKKSFLKAEEMFKKVFDAEHMVFKLIQEYYNEIEKASGTEQ